MKISTLLTPNAVSFWALFICCLAFGCALHLQQTVGLVPCPLCIVQRFILMILALLFLMGALFRHTHKGRRYYYPWVILVALVGMGVSWRHVWLLSHPALANSCGADFFYMLNTLPLTETLRLVFQGGGDCARQTWAWHGLTLPEWSGVIFALLGVMAISQLYRQNSK